MKKFALLLSALCLVSGTAMANDEKTAPAQATSVFSEHWYKPVQSKIEFYGTIDIGYQYTSH